MAPRPPIQAVVEAQAELDTSRRNWRMVLFNEDGTPFAGGGAAPDTDWIDIPLINGWADYPGRPVQYRIEDGGKSVRWRGTLDGQAKTGDAFAVIPASFNATEYHMGVMAWNPGVGYGFGEFTSEPAGDGNLHCYIAAIRCALLDGESVGLD